MEIAEYTSLASLTTLKVGGNSRYLLTCATTEDIERALAFARERSLTWYVLGGGSNILADDDGYEGVIIRIANNSITITPKGSEVAFVVVADAGTAWDALVTETVVQGLWGLENLAGIPGTVGAAPVQNIGAYGADVSGTLAYVDAYNTKTETLERLTNEQCAFGYRDSLFKQDASYIILRVAFALSTAASPHIQYADLQAAEEQGRELDTPERIADEVRNVRSKKFPDLQVTGTAGSFFKNPTISVELFEKLTEKYPELPGFVVTETTRKIPLGWILDHVLGLRGYKKGAVRLFEKQALVVVAEKGATGKDIDMFAKEVAEKVFIETGIEIEREVRMLQNKKV